MQLFELFATLGLDTRNFDSQIGRATESGRSFASKLSSGLSKTVKTVAVIGTAAVGTVGAAFIKMGKDAMGVFADLEQNIGGSEAVFGRWAQVIQNAGAYAFKNVGLAQDQYLAEANKMGSLLQGMGIAQEDSAKMTIDWMQRASDVASIMGVDVSSAMQAIEGAAKGNFTMMDNLGVAMNDTSLQAYALEKGIAGTWSEMSQAEKIGVAYQMFMEKTAQYAGNYAKENSTLSGSITSLKASWRNFLSGAGTADDVADMLGNTIEAVTGAADTLLPRLADGLGTLFEKVGPMVQPLMEKLLPSLKKGTDAMLKALPGASKGAAKGAANGIIYLINQTFGTNIPSIKEIRWPTWDDVEAAFGYAWEVIQAGATSLMKLVFGENNKGGIKWPTWTDVKAAFNTAWNTIKNGAKSVMKLVFGETEDGGIDWPTWEDVQAAATAAWDTIKAGVATLGGLIFGKNEDGTVKWPTWEDVQAAAEDVWGKIKEGVAAFGDLIFGKDEQGNVNWPTFDEAIEWAKTNIWEGTIKPAVEAFGGLVFGKDEEGQVQWPSSFANALEWARTNIWDGVIKKGVSEFGGLIFGKDEDGKVNFPSVDEVREAANEFWGKVGEGIKDIFTIVLDVITPDSEEEAQMVSDWWFNEVVPILDTVLNYTLALFGMPSVEDMAKAIDNWWTDVGKTVKNLPLKIVDGIFGTNYADERAQSDFVMQNVLAKDPATGKTWAQQNNEKLKLKADTEALTEDLQAAYDAYVEALNESEPMKVPISYDEFVLNELEKRIDSVEGTHNVKFNIGVGFGGFNLNSTSLVPGFATGLDYVPSNNFPAFLHEGEAVLTKLEAENWRSGRTSSMQESRAMSMMLDRMEQMVNSLANIHIEMDKRVVGELVTETVSRGIAAQARAGRYGRW